MVYPILSIRADEREDFEQLGSKPKFWFLRDGQKWLFKESRDTAGEDWSEKVAAEICTLLEIPAARVELAESAGHRGSASLSFLGAGEVLLHGNEILAGTIQGYDKTKRFQQCDHTLENILAAVNILFDEPAREAVFCQFASYLVLDALIGNVDRHHENWGLVMRFKPDGQEREVELLPAPTFDHASSLGRERTDAFRQRVLGEGEKGIARYLDRGHGGIYFRPSDPHGPSPLDLVQFAIRHWPEYFTPALKSVSELKLDEIGHILSLVPDDRISPLARDFALLLIQYAASRLGRLIS